MGANGMKKNNEFNEINSSVNVSLKILPFGSISYEIKGSKYPMEKEEIMRPRYIEPLTTNIEKVDIVYEESGTYSVPKTTA